MSNDKATKMVVIQKLAQGKLLLEFQNALTYSDLRTIAIGPVADTYRIPLGFAVSMFQIEGTYSLYKQGYFTFLNKEDKELVFQFARELQIYFGEGDSGKKAHYEQPIKLYTEAEIRQFVQLGRTKTIKEILEYDNPAQIGLLASAVQDNYGKVTNEVIQLIEEKLGVSLEGDE